MLKQVFLPLFFGVCIYLFFRPNQTLAENFMNWNLQTTFSFNKYWISTVFLGSLPDFLWLFSLLSLMRIIWGAYENIPLVLKTLLYTVPIFSEFLQFMDVIPGTGDVFDVLAYLLAIIIFQNKFFYNQNQTQ